VKVFETKGGESVIAIADCIDTLESVAQSGGCDLVLMSPPYLDARTYGANVTWRFEDYQRLGDATYAALRPGGQAIVVLDAPVRVWRKGFGTERAFTPWEVMIDWGRRVGFRVPDRLAYGRMGARGGYRGRFRNDWEPLLWFEKLGKKPYFDKWALAEDAKWGYFLNEKNKRIKSWHKEDGLVARRASGRGVKENKKHRGTLWSYHAGHNQDGPGFENPKHPARFSTKFAEDAVRCFCQPDGLVCDPLVGSGTSAIATVRHGRRFVGGDLYKREPDGRPWARVAHERVLVELSR
jgi:hypothetical protein